MPPDTLHQVVDGTEIYYSSAVSFTDSHGIISSTYKIPMKVTVNYSEVTMSSDSVTNTYAVMGYRDDTDVSGLTLRIFNLSDPKRVIRMMVITPRPDIVFVKSNGDMIIIPLSK